MESRTLEELLVQYREVEATYQALLTLTGEAEASRIELEHAARYELTSEKQQFFVPVRVGYTSSSNMIVQRDAAGRTLVLVETNDGRAGLQRSYSIVDA